MIRRSERSTFGVKTVFKITALGEPKGMDEHYRPDLAMIEERIVLIEAQGHDHAIALAEAQATRYAENYSHTNPYGQEVRCEYLGLANSYEAYPFEEQDETFPEVFSATRVLDASTTDAAIADALLGPEEPPGEWRRVFLNVAFNGPAPGFDPHAPSDA